MVRGSEGRQTASLKVGDLAPDFTLEDSAGVQHSLSSLRGSKVLLSFFRFAACPFTLMSMDTMKTMHEMMKNAGIKIVCVYKSTPSMIANFSSETCHVLALSDKKGAVYKSYQVTQTAGTALKYEVEGFTHLKKFKPYFKLGLKMKDTHFAGMKISPGMHMIIGVLRTRTLVPSIRSLHCVIALLFSFLEIDVLPQLTF